jgi:hypothetical protein
MDQYTPLCLCFSDPIRLIPYLPCKESILSGQSFHYFGQGLTLRHIQSANSRFVQVPFDIRNSFSSSLHGAGIVVGLEA